MKKIIFQKTIKDFKKEFPALKEKVLLKDHTTWRVGGPAKYFLEVQNREDLEKAIGLAKEISLPFFVLAGGSNILVSDKGFNGLVVKIKILDLEIKEENGKIKVLAGAGLPLNFLSAKLLESGAGGLEWSSSIPGTLGGAVFGNAGAFGPSMAGSVEWVEALEIGGKKIKFKKYLNKDCDFSYRSSVFKKKTPGIIIVSARLSLNKADKEAIRSKMKEYADYRRARHPLDLPSAGSVFKNPAQPIKNKILLAKFPELAVFNQKGEIPAGWLTEKAGLRGKRIGGAQISEKHSNFFVNLGRAKARDIRALIKFAKKKVKKVFGAELKEEIIHLE
jgi:UDP-N-acetylmuramate dehydrogenase